MAEMKMTRTTFGLFFEWYIGWRYDHTEKMQPRDVNAQMLKKYISAYVEDTFWDDKRKFDLFFGVDADLFGDDYEAVAESIRKNFDTPIDLVEYVDGPTLWVKFIINGTQFDMEIGASYGEYEYDADADGFRK